MTGHPPRDQLIAANEDAAQFYRRHLLGPDGVGPRRYLTQRGFATLLNDTPWTVGHAPATWTALHDHLSELGYSDEAQLGAGLTSISRRGQMIDRFRDRITFGIRDQQDQLVGFTARTGPVGRDPKYLNTPRTDLFDKSAELFGLGEATRSPARTYVLVEGPLDAIAVTIAEPATAALALCGTALTDKHALLLRSATHERLVLALDGDVAGTRALENAASVLCDDRAVAVRRPQQDPAGILAYEGPIALSRALSSARPAAEVLLEAHLAKWPDRLDSAEAAIGCLREAATMIARIRPADVAALATRLSHETRLPTLTVSTELVDALNSRDSTRMSSTSHRVDREHVALPHMDRWQTRSAPAPQR